MSCFKLKVIVHFLKIVTYLLLSRLSTSECSFGNDPLADDGALRNRREAEFVQNNPSFSQIFENVIIGNGALMETTILSFINITRYLSP